MFNEVIIFAIINDVRLISVDKVIFKKIVTHPNWQNGNVPPDIRVH